eukprot:12277009-Alexandrium_andersonii.AAC.1
MTPPDRHPTAGSPAGAALGHRFAAESLLNSTFAPQHDAGREVVPWDRTLRHLYGHLALWSELAQAPTSSP